MRTLDCNHFFCDECLKGHIIPLLKSKLSILSGIRCPLCTKKINHYTIQALTTKSEFEKYERRLIELMEDMVECPKCNFTFQTSDKKIVCRLCNHNFCVTCKKKTENCECEVDDISSVIDQCEADGLLISTCPGCKSLYLKDQGCEHVECEKENCRTAFCFQCAAFREPTLAHGAHYHRPNCQFYSDYDGKDDKYEEKCKFCRKEGKICTKPKTLIRVRRIGNDES